MADTSPGAPPSSPPTPVPRRRRWLRVLLTSFGALALLVALAPTILSATIARSKAAAILGEALQRRVEIGSVSIGWTTGARVEGLVVYEKDGTTPFAKVGSAEAKVSILPLLSGTIALEHARAAGLDARVVRRADGTLSTDDLGKRPGQPKPDEPPGPQKEGSGWRFRMGEVSAHDGSFHLVLESTSETIEVGDLELAAGPGETPEEVKATFSFRLFGGTSRTNATVRLGSEAPAYEISTAAEGVHYDVKLGRLLALVNPLLYSEHPGQVEATMRWDLEAKGRGFSLEEMKKALAGKGKLSLDKGALVGTPLISELFTALEVGGPARYDFEGMKMAFRIEDGKVVNECSDPGGKDSKADLSIAGWTDLDGNMKQTLSVKGDPRARWGKTTGAVIEVLVKAGGIPVGGTVSLPKLDLDYEKALAGIAKGLLESPEAREAAKDLADRAADALGGLFGGRKKR